MKKPKAIWTIILVIIAVLSFFLTKLFHNLFERDSNNSPVESTRLVNADSPSVPFYPSEYKD